MVERSIIIGLITSTEYLESIQSIWDIKFIESAVAKRLAQWCWEYFESYKKAPGRDIETIYYAKLKEGKLPKDLFSEIEEEILPGLSKEYERSDFNLEYLMTETKKYFDDRHLLLHNQQVEALRAEGKTVEAEELILNFRPLGLAIANIDDHIKTAEEIRATKIKPPRTLLSPWLKEGQTVILYGNYGSGKSLLTMLISYILGLKDYTCKEAEIGEWQVKHPTGCLYVDGELGQQEMESRFRGYEWLGKQHSSIATRIFAIPEYQLATEDSFFLGERRNQIKLVHWLKDHPNYKLIVLDSVSTLFGIKEENDNSEWNTKINPLLRDFRALNVACLLLHHAGKDGKKGLRGASSQGAMANYILRLTNHPLKDIDAGEAWMVLGKDKQRAGGYQFKPFGIHFFQEGKETHWEITETDE